MEHNTVVAGIYEIHVTSYAPFNGGDCAESKVSMFGAGFAYAYALAAANCENTTEVMAIDAFTGELMFHSNRSDKIRYVSETFAKDF